MPPGRPGHPLAGPARAYGTSIRRRAWPNQGSRPGFGQVLVVAIGLTMGPDRGITFCAVVDPSKRLGTE
jgi:hypothetical protein